MKANQVLRDRTALVTGANRGLGLETCAQLASLGARVILTARDGEKGQQAANHLKGSGVPVSFVQMDVTSPASIQSAMAGIAREFKTVDILINNAGILPDNDTEGTFTDRSILETDSKLFLQAFETNTLGVIEVCKAIVPLMKARKWGRIVNVSSLVAQLSTMDSGIPAYRISKVALNAVTRILADELKPEGILCNCLSPGWVKTDMGGQGASISIEEGARQILSLACLPDDGPTGQFFREGKTIAW